MDERFMLSARVPLLRGELARAELLLIAVEERDARMAARMHAELDDAFARSRDALGEFEAAVNGATPLPECWGMYRDLRALAGKLFGESLAFMQSVLGRKAGIDDGLAEVADAFLDELSTRCGVHWGRVTVVAESEFLARFAGIVRLRFPSLTVWDLPIAAHEFGHFVTGEAAGPLEELLAAAHAQGGDPGRSEQDELIADAFATYTCGPAYPCTTLLLRFDAGRAAVRPWLHPPAAERAHLQLAMLRELDARRPFAPAFSGISARLSQRWEAAVAAAGRPGGLAPERAGALDELAAALCGHFRDLLNDGAAFTSLDPAARLAGTLAGDGLALEPGDTFADVLNAAWLARLDAWDDAREPPAAVAANALAGLRTLIPEGVHAGA